MNVRIHISDAWDQEMSRLMEYFSDIPDDCVFWINLDPTNPKDRPQDDDTVWYYTARLQCLCFEKKLFPTITPVGMIYSKKRLSMDMLGSLLKIPVRILRNSFRENQKQEFLSCLILHMYESFATQEDR